MWSRVLRHGLRLCGDGDEPRPPGQGYHRRLDRLCHLPHRHLDGGRRRPLRPGVGALHLLSAAARQRLVLFRGNPAHRRLDDLGRVDDLQHDGVEARQSWQARAARHVRYRATAVLWAWSASGVELEMIGIVLPRVFGWTVQMDAGLARTLFSVTLHSIVYFWLMPAYIAFYTLVPQAAGGRLYSDTMGRLTFVMFILFATPVGIHHLFADPEIGLGFKYIQSFLTFLVALPTLLTVFAVCASLEIAGRHRGGKGLLGWIAALPWNEPMVLAVGLSLVMLGFGGAGGLINMAYDMNLMIHNTAWVPAHFHLIFGGAVVIMYFAIAYEMWPRITDKPLRSKQMARWQLWLWFIGMFVMTIPWHITGLMGQPRRVAIFDYSDPLLAPMAPLAVLSVIGGLILLTSAILFITVLVRSQVGEGVLQTPLRYALAVNPPVRVPKALNGFALWNAILLMFMVLEYGYPIGQFFVLKSSVPVYEVSQQSSTPGVR